jgi:predicted transcriptional regulator
MTEEKTKMKKFIQNGVIRYQRVEATAEDLLQERDLEIKHLHELIDTLRSKIETLEQEQQRQTLLDKEAGPVSSYECYI